MMEIEWIGPLWEGFIMTVEFFFLTLAMALPLGLSLAILHYILPRGIKWVLNTYVYLFRGTPLLLQMMFVFFGFPLMNLWVLDRFSAALVTLVLNYAAYFLEIFRGGIQAIPSGQFEVIKTLSIRPLIAWRKVLLPQVWRIVLPSIANEVISLVKDTSLIYVLGLNDLLKVGRTLSNQNASMVPYVYVGIIYLIFNGLVSLALKKIEMKMEVNA